MEMEIFFSRITLDSKASKDIRLSDAAFDIFQENITKKTLDGFQTLQKGNRFAT